MNAGPLYRFAVLRRLAAHRCVDPVENVLDRVENLPQVQSAVTIQFLPPSRFTNNGPFHSLGRILPPDPRSMESDVSTVRRGILLP